MSPAVVRGSAAKTKLLKKQYPLRTGIVVLYSGSIIVQQHFEARFTAVPPLFKSHIKIGEIAMIGRNGISKRAKRHVV